MGPERIDASGAGARDTGHIGKRVADGVAAAGAEAIVEGLGALRRAWILAAVIAAGLGSRAVQTGWIVTDKYLGDALYAVMVYLLAGRRVALAMGIMTAIECFQLTGIPAQLAAGGSVWERMCGRLLGTVFSLWDLLAYAAGIGGAWLVERAMTGDGKGGRLI